MPEQRPNKKKPQYNDLGRYGGMAFQMLAIMAAGAYGGIKLDQYLGFKKIPVFTLLLSLLSAAAAIYLFIKDVLKKK